MAIGFKHGAAGGPAMGLSIVSGSKPTAPKENTIWVDSGTTVGSWVISSTEPDGAAGRFWVKADHTGTVALDVTSGKNRIVVQPVTAYEYTGEGWAARNAEVYLNGAWRALEDLDGFYFKDGNQCTDVTGGWTTDGWGNAGTVNVGSTIVLSAATNQAARIGTVKPVDLTNVNKIWCDSPNGMNGKYYGGYLCIKNTKDQPGNPFRSAIVNAPGKVSLDVSAYSGNYYIYVYAYGGGESYLDIRAIWAE